MWGCPKSHGWIFSSRRGCGWMTMTFFVHEKEPCDLLGHFSHLFQIPLRLSSNVLLMKIRMFSFRTTNLRSARRGMWDDSWRQKIRRANDGWSVWGSPFSKPQTENLHIDTDVTYAHQADQAYHTVFFFFRETSHKSSDIGHRSVWIWDICFKITFWCGKYWQTINILGVPQFKETIWGSVRRSCSCGR